MTWNSSTDTDLRVAKMVVKWIYTARGSGQQYPDNWLPTEADIHKSALFERIRSGKEPLPEPPPLGMSCPWYAVVEDPGPHFVMDAGHVSKTDWGYKEGKEHYRVLQSLYEVTETRGPKDFIVKDVYHDTSYRFRLWFDADWRHPNPMVKFEGGWFLQNVDFL